MLKVTKGRMLSSVAVQAMQHSQAGIDSIVFNFSEII